MAPSLYVWSEWADALGIALRVQADGVKVAFRVVHEPYRDCGRGLVPLTQAEPPKGALVLFDSTGFGRHGRRLRRQGHPVIGGNPFERQLEVDRTAGAEIMQAAGIALPETHGFRTITEAVKFLGHEDGAWFVKFSGDHETALTHGTQSAEAMIRHLHWLEKTRTDLTQGLELQRKVKGVEVDVEGWFDGQQFVRPFNLTFEDKKFLAGSRGPRTGCEANVVCFLDGETPTLAAHGVLRLEDALREQGYVGPIGFNQIVGEDGISYGLEFTARTGWDAFIAYMNLFDATFFEQLEAFARGELRRWEPADEGAMSLTLRLSVPPYPGEVGIGRALKLAKGMPLDPALLEYDLVSLVDVMRGEDRGPVLAGASGHLGTLGAVGRDLKDLRKTVLDRADELDIGDLQYRVDPIKRADRDWKKLADLGVFEAATEEVPA